MRAFSYISIIGTLALATFTSAAPQPVVVENGVVARHDSCDGCDFLQGIINKLEDPCSSITDNHGSAPVDVDGLSGLLKDIISIVEDAISQLNSNHKLLDGLDQPSCINLLGTLINLILGVVRTVLRLLSSCSPHDQDILKALLTTLFSLVGDLVCLVTAIVCSLLGTILSLVGSLLGALSGLVGNLSDIFVILTGCKSHWPGALGGSLSAIKL